MKTFRIVFDKHGPLVFVSHLDFSHFFVRAIKRADLPLKYSEGFSPHPKVVFGLPLSVGMRGMAELVDITLTDDNLTCKQVSERISAAMPNDVDIIDVYEANVKLGKITSAEYEICFENFVGENDRILACLENPPDVTKKTKSGTTKTIELKPLIKSFDCQTNGNITTLTLVLAASGDNYLNPELVLSSISSYGIDFPEEYTVTRTKILFE